MEWTTDRQTGTRVTVGIMAWLLLFDLLLIWIALQLPVTFWTFVIGLVVLASLPVFAILAYYLVSLRSSSYALDRNALTITWGPTQQTIPMASIERILPGPQVAGKMRFRGGYWPGLWVGHAQVEDLGVTFFYATTIRRADLIFVVTPEAAYALSPAEQLKFLEAYEQRKTMGPTQEVPHSSRHPELFDWPLWNDKLAWELVGLAALAVLLLFGLLTWRFPGLPYTLPLHYDLAGQPDRIGDRSQIFILPFIGLLTFLVNGSLGGLAYQRKETFAAYLLWAGALLVQVMLWVAALGIV